MMRRSQPVSNTKMRYMKEIKLFCTAAAACVLAASCAQDAPMVGNARYLFKPDKMVGTAREVVADGHWDPPAGITGEHLIVVDTQRQQAKYYIGGREVGFSSIASGKAGHGTPQGTFTVLAKDIDHKSSTYGSIVDSAGNVLIADYTRGSSTPIPPGGRYRGAEMNFGLQLTNTGIWMHEGLVTSAPESHGCIRLPRKMAKIFYENTPVGTKVIIK